MKHTNIMVDLETLGTSPGCKIMSIGAVAFDTDETGDEFYIEISRDEQAGLVEEPETLVWWAKQDPNVYDRLFNSSESKYKLEGGLRQFNAWLACFHSPALWGNGPDFDNAILQYAYKHVGISPAWVYRHNRCYRTLKSLCPRIKAPKRIGPLHNALDDARHQALHAVELMRFLENCVDSMDVLRYINGQVPRPHNPDEA